MEITLNVHISGLEGLAEALKALTSGGAAARAESTAPAALVGAAPTAPIAAPRITQEQICKAGADLLAANPGLMPQLSGLLQRYGIKSATELKPEQAGAFATELREMGANI